MASHGGGQGGGPGFGHPGRDGRAYADHDGSSALGTRGFDGVAEGHASSTAEPEQQDEGLVTGSGWQFGPETGQAPEGGYSRQFQAEKKQLVPLPAGTNDGHPFTLEEGERMLRVRLDGDDLYAKQGAMVAYRGQIDFAQQGHGLGGHLRRAVTGDAPDLIRARGSGTVWLAEAGSHISIFNLAEDRLVINGRSLLALQSSLEYRTMKTSGGFGAMIAGGSFDTEVAGTGAVAVLCLGNPLVLPTDEPVCVDRDAAVAWTAGVTTRLVSTFKLGSLIGRSSSELAQVEYSDPGGHVVVQCGEPTAGGAADHCRH